jgi:hypothetical protein
MSHPLKSDAASAHSSKLRSMTTHYGLASGPSNNITTPGERLKGEAGEDHVGFGADSANATAKRGDRPARRSVAANPVPTYARGGKVKHKDSGGPVEEQMAEANEAKEAAEPRNMGGIIARARGGRAKGGKHGTHVNVIVAPQGGPPAGGAPSPQLAALAAGAHPPMGGPPPGAPPMGGPPPGMPPGAPPPGMPPMRARGGKVMGDHPDAAQDKELIEKTLREEGLVHKAKGGGVHMTAGAVTGNGRLEKMGVKIPAHRGSLEPKEV